MIENKIIHTILAVLVTLVGAGVVTQIEQQLDAATPLIAARPMSAEEATQIKTRSVLRDNIAMLWIGGGAVLGGFMIVGYKRVSGFIEISRYFCVSTACSLAITPWLLHRVREDLPNEPHECFFYAFIVAAIAWLTLEVCSIIAGRIYTAAKDRGISGVKDELLVLLSLGIWSPKKDGK